MVEKAGHVYWMFCNTTDLLCELKALLASTSNAPINIKPHYPPPGRTWENCRGFDPI